MSIFRDNKQEFLNEIIKENPSHIFNYEEAYKNNIETFEIKKNKDLKDFNKDEVKEVTGRKMKSKTGYKTITETFVFEYLDFTKMKEKEEKKTKKQQEKEAREKLKAEKEEKIKSYVEQKEVYMKEFHSDKEEITKKTYMDCYKSAIAPLEAYKEKDLYKFIEDDIIELFDSVPTTSINVKRMVWNFINSYFIWAESKGLLLTHHNPLQTLDKDELFELNLKAFRKQFLSLDETYKICEDAIKNGSNYQDCIIVLLNRYGISGKAVNEIINLREEDVDAEKKKIRIVDEETGEIRELDIDDRLVEWIEKAIDCYVYDYKWRRKNKETGDYETYDNEKPFYDKGYIVKVQNEDDEKETKDNIYRRIAKVCECVGIRPLSTKNLVISRQFDNLDEIREIKGDKMEVGDVIYVHSLYYPNASASAYWTLKEKYEIYRNISIDNRQPTGVKPRKKVDVDNLEE